MPYMLKEHSIPAKGKREQIEIFYISQIFNDECDRMNHT